MNRIAYRSLQVAIDVALLSAAYWLAFSLRFDWNISEQMFKRVLFTWPYVVALEYGFIWLLGANRYSWRFVGLREAKGLFAASTLATLVLIGLWLGARASLPGNAAAQYALVPMSVILANYLLSFFALAGVRVLRRSMGEQADTQRQERPTEMTNTLLIGAGQAGVMVAKEIHGRPDLGIRPVGFLDDDPVKTGQVVHGVRVLGSPDDIARHAAATHAEAALITIADAPGTAIRRLAVLCREAGLDVKIIPGIYEIVGGQVNLSRIRDVAIEDLLGRDPVELDKTAIGETLRGRVALVTGAGGSIGSELCRQVARFSPERLVLVEQAETSLFYIHRELSQKYPDLNIVPVMGDVCDLDRMEVVFEQQKPSIVFHAAAYKHVPMMEWNPCEALKNNVIGTRIIADLSDRFGVREFVLVSTDKAVNPTSVMGASKRVAEMYTQALSTFSKTKFVTVRFGNVLGSAGSVIPIFKEQIAAGGPVTVTDPEMTRFFMTIPEASQLILQAATMGDGGEIFILDMGEPVKIVDLARDLITLSGLTPDVDIEINFSGIRPGEKLYEELSVEEENAGKTKHPKIFVGNIRPKSLAHIATGIEDLVEGADTACPLELRRRLCSVVPEYQPKDLEKMIAAHKEAQKGQPVIQGTLEVEPEEAVASSHSGPAERASRTGA